MLVFTHAGIMRAITLDLIMSDALSVTPAQVVTIVTCRQRAQSASLTACTPPNPVLREIGSQYS